jgi:hypothetical protein
MRFENPVVALAGGTLADRSVEFDSGYRYEEQTLIVSSGWNGPDDALDGVDFYGLHAVDAAIVRVALDDSITDAGILVDRAAFLTGIELFGCAVLFDCFHNAQAAHAIEDIVPMRGDVLKLRRGNASLNGPSAAANAREVMHEAYSAGGATARYEQWRSSGLLDFRVGVWMLKAAVLATASRAASALGTDERAMASVNEYLRLIGSRGRAEP